jgi:hypothetical protein
MSAHADGQAGLVVVVLFGQPFGFAAHDRARLVRERQARQTDDRLQMGVRAIHVGADHREGDFMAGLVARDLEIGGAQALVIGLGARHFLLDCMHTGLLCAVISLRGSRHGERARSHVNDAMQRDCRRL